MRRRKTSREVRMYMYYPKFQSREKELGGHAKSESISANSLCDVTSFLEFLNVTYIEQTKLGISFASQVSSSNGLWKNNFAKKYRVV